MSHSAYRLKAPLIKENGRFRKASWDEALDRVVQAIESIEPAKLGYFRGNDFNNWVHEALFRSSGLPQNHPPAHVRQRQPHVQRAQPQ